MMPRSHRAGERMASTRGAGRHADRHAALRRLGVAAQQCSRVPSASAQQLERVLVSVCGGGRGDAAHAAFEQLHPEILFEIAHLLADRRLRDMQRLARM